MKTPLCVLLLVVLTGWSHSQQGRLVEAYSRIYKHKDGTQTKTRKDGNKNEIHEETYRNNVLICKQTFLTDSKGRLRRGWVQDGKLNPLGVIEFGYDPATDQLVEERKYNKDGKLIRRLFYPGTVKIKDLPELANRFVALNYDPNRPDAKPVRSHERVQPTRPVESDQEEFTPGIPIAPGNAGTPVTAGTATTAAPAPAAKQPAARPARFFHPKPRQP